MSSEVENRITFFGRDTEKNDLSAGWLLGWFGCDPVNGHDMSPFRMT